ncbi:hypothetical protein V6N11_017448 [Hibiscus sabdariffa]|uniref:Uncharacterized protein n=1 Tax=Hibiscus sabdariffa TaxID=183260 RepID=A0ABR2TY23_9ROSI
MIGEDSFDTTDMVFGEVCALYSFHFDHCNHRVEQCVVFHNLHIVAYDCDRILDKDLSRRKSFKVPSVVWCRANTRMLQQKAFVDQLSP